MNINLSPPKRSLVEQVMDEIHSMIEARQLTPGDKIPSIRKLAAQLNVSKSTIVEAYDRLAAEQVIQAKPGSGYYVSGQLAPLSLKKLEPQLDRTIDPFWVSRQSLEADAEFAKPGCGWLPPSWMPEKLVRKSLRQIARSSDSLLADYGTPLGHEALRQWLARQINIQQQVISPDQIILTESGTQAIDLLCRFLLKPGDRVLIDDPCYFNFQALLKAHQVEIISVPFTPNGPDLDQAEQLICTNKPRLYLTNSGIHNPTGATLAPTVAHQMLKLAEAHGMIVVEDEIFGHLETTPLSTRYATIDGLNQVVQIGSFSKTISAAIRCGYIATKADWIDPLVDLKIATTFGGNPISAEVIYKVLIDGGYRKHLLQLHNNLAHAMNKTIATLEQLDFKPWLKPKAGMYLWTRLPDNCDAANLAQTALKEKIILAPGNAFSHRQKAQNLMRFNVSQCGDDRVFEVLMETLSTAKTHSSIKRT